MKILFLGPACARIEEHLSIVREGSTKSAKEGTKEKIEFVQASKFHCDFIFSIINDPVVRHMSFDKNAIPYDEHYSWFMKQIDKKIPFLIAFYIGEPCGYVRFDKNEGEATISVALHEKFRGKGLGTVLIHQASQKVLQETDIQKIVAHVKSINKSSILAFKQAFFVQCSEKFADKCVLYYPEDMNHVS